MLPCGAGTLADEVCQRAHAQGCLYAQGRAEASYACHGLSNACRIIMSMVLHTLTHGHLPSATACMKVTGRLITYEKCMYP